MSQSIPPRNRILKHIRHRSAIDSSAKARAAFTQMVEPPPFSEFLFSPRSRSPGGGHGERSMRVRSMAHMPGLVAMVSPREAEDADGDGTQPLEEMSDNRMRLYSYYVPSLTGGSHTISAYQRVKDPRKPVTDPGILLTSVQQFNVHSPRFRLPTGVVHSTYPPQGLADHNSILPHIVFNDPHFPWAQEGSGLQAQVDADERERAEKEWEERKKKKRESGVRAGEEEDEFDWRPRNKVPWIALWSFTEVELALSESDLKSTNASPKGLFPPRYTDPPVEKLDPTTGVKTKEEVEWKQNKTTFEVEMTLGEYLLMGGDYKGRSPRSPGTKTVTIPLQDDDVAAPILRDEKVDVVFIRRSVFEGYVSSYDSSGQRVPIPDPTTQLQRPVRNLPDGDLEEAPLTTHPSRYGIPDLSRYQYLSHVRNVNTVHTATDDDDGIFSIVLGHRAGPLDLSAPKPVVVHLVSLQDIEDNIALPITTEWVGLISLHSWTYSCLPPDQVNFLTTMRNIGNTIRTSGSDCFLRAPTRIIRSIAGLPSTPPPSPLARPGLNIRDILAQSLSPPLPLRLAHRLEDGYSLVRYLTRLGEESVAFYRGPLTPNYTAPITAAWWPWQSNFSTDYQVLDPHVGVMDITYSAAWQLGRTLGIADQAFTAALVRIRGSTDTEARRQVKTATVAAGVSSGVVRGAGEVLRDMAMGIRKPGVVAAGKVPGGISALSRFSVQTVAPPVRSTQDIADIKRKLFVSSASRAITALASSLSPDATTNIPTLPFNEISVPYSPDWQLVQSFLLDKLFLHNIPAHYLFPDPSHLPPESIRFFYIDDNWLDALIDGALSIGNHLEQRDDVIRQALKRNLNRYFETRLGDRSLNYPPQIPKFGFFLRSSVVAAFPDLEIHAPWEPLTDVKEGAPLVPVEERKVEVLKQELLEKDVLMCLFDRVPGHKDFNNITLSQPAHQMCFRLGDQLTYQVHSVTGQREGRLDINFKKLYTEKGGAEKVPRSTRWDPVSNLEFPQSEPQPTILGRPAPAILDYGMRTLVFPAFANVCLDVLNEESGKSSPGNGFFDDDTPTAALVGAQLNMAASRLTILTPERGGIDGGAAPDPMAPRRIRLPPDDTDPASLWPHFPPPQKPKPSLTPSPSDSSDTPPTHPPSDPPPSDPPPPPPPPKGLPPPSTWRKTLPPATTIILTGTTDRRIPSFISPQFICTTFVLGTPPPPLFPPPSTSIPIPTIPYYPPNHPLDLPFDLIIRLLPSPFSPPLPGLALFAIIIDLPQGPGPNDLVLSYEGSGGRMLSNQRFNVHFNDETATRDRETGWLRFTLIPRSTTKTVEVERVEDMSFVVYQLRTNKVPGLCTLRVNELYKVVDEPGGPQRLVQTSGGGRRGGGAMIAKEVGRR